MNFVIVIVVIIGILSKHFECLDERTFDTTLFLKVSDFMSSISIN